MGCQFCPKSKMGKELALSFWIVLDAFKAACLFSPSKFYELKPSAADIDCLNSIPISEFTTEYRWAEV